MPIKSTRLSKILRNPGCPCFCGASVLVYLDANDATLIIQGLGDGFHSFGGASFTKGFMKMP